MTVLVWDNPGERVYQTGVDRGVLYLQDGRVAVWNGLTNVEENPNKETKPYYLDGLKYLEYISPGDFSAKLTAFTYPDEFDEVNGIFDPAPGLHAYDQPSKSFGLSYRTKIGNDLDSDAGYLIHLLYNILANPDSYEYSSIGSETTPTEFSWSLSGKPVTDSIGNWRPTAHFSIDSRDISPELLQAYEDVLYGTTENDPSLPSIDELFNIVPAAPVSILNAEFIYSIP